MDGEETKERSKAIIFFDGTCNLCSGAVLFVIPRDPSGYFRLAALQSDAAIRLLGLEFSGKQEMDTVILLEHQKVYQKSTAVLRIARRLNGAWPLLYGLIIIPRPIRDFVYNLVARNRYQWFGKKDACLVPTDEIMERFL